MSADFIERAPKGFITTDAVDDQGDIVLIPIEEWKELYGTPGNGTGVDINGRINGFFPTEPEFCEDAPELLPFEETNRTEQTGDAA
jgi:hypothetical protein